MFRSILSTALAVIVLIIACDDSSVNPDGDSALFYVTVTDTLGNPVDNLIVSSTNHSDYFFDTAKKLPPATTINFQLTEPGPYNLFIVNYYREIIEHFSGDGSTGFNSVIWDSYGALSGYYTYILYIGDTANPADYAEKDMILANYPTPAILGTTDSNGVFYTDDTLFFPCLLGDPPVIYAYDQYGNPTDTIYDYYNDTVTIYLRDTLTNEYLYFVKPLVVGSNNFELLWDPGIQWQNPGIR